MNIRIIAINKSLASLIFGACLSANAADVFSPQSAGSVAFAEQESRINRIEVDLKAVLKKLEGLPSNSNAAEEKKSPNESGRVVLPLPLSKPSISSSDFLISKHADTLLS